MPASQSAFYNLDGTINMDVEELIDMDSALAELELDIMEWEASKAKGKN